MFAFLSSFSVLCGVSVYNMRRDCINCAQLSLFRSMKNVVGVSILTMSILNYLRLVQTMLRVGHFHD
jgi:hypothetical protein